MAAERESDKTEIRNSQLQGDEGGEAMAQVFAQQYPRLVYLATKMTGDHATAEDIVQSAFAGTWKNRSNLQSDVLSSTYLRRAVINGVIGHTRSRRVIPVDATSTILDSSSLDPASMVVDNAQLKDMLSALSPVQRQAVVLVDILEFPVKAAAEILNVSPGTVKSRAARARAKMKSNLNKG